MEWLEQNIDAYRIVSEILGQLRLVIRQRLELLHGDEWHQKGLPAEVYKRLVAAKEREKSIDWYEGQYQELLDYAVFADLIEILEHNPELFKSFLGLAPSATLLNARFLELDVMRAKLGRARPISETELSFLGTFHLRFRKAAQEAEEDEIDVSSVASASKEEPVPATSPEVVPPPRPETAPGAQEPGAPPPPPGKPQRPVRAMATLDPVSRLTRKTW